MGSPTRGNEWAIWAGGVAAAAAVVAVHSCSRFALPPPPAAALPELPLLDGDGDDDGQPAAAAPPARAPADRPHTSIRGARKGSGNAAAAARGGAEDDGEARATLTFYQYLRLAKLPALRMELAQEWGALGLRGRVFLAEEGINAQCSVPLAQRATFEASVRAHFPGAAVKQAVAERGPVGRGRGAGKVAFGELSVLIKRQLVADGLGSGEVAVDPSTGQMATGAHLDAFDWNRRMAEPSAVVVDMRNGYESAVGRFQTALCAPVCTTSLPVPCPSAAPSLSRCYMFLMTCWFQSENEGERERVSAMLMMSAMRARSC